VLKLTGIPNWIKDRQSPLIPSLKRFRKNMDSQMEIVFSPRAQERLEGLADYLFEKTGSSEFVNNYLTKL